MRRALTVTLAALIAVMVGGPLGAPAAFAANSSVESWLTVGSIRPDIGCNVPISVEVRSGGAAVAGAEVDVLLTSDDTGQLLASDRQITGDNGVAYLTVNTGNGWDGAKSWLEVDVNGGYLGGRSMWITSGGACDGQGDVTDLSGSVPTASNTVVDTSSSQQTSPSQSSSGQHIISGVPTYVQQRNLSCEYAALSIATGALGNQVSEYNFDNIVGWSDNPHWGYRGNITGPWGGTTDYGVYAEALVPALADYGFTGQVFYGQGDATPLKNAIDQGKPTLVWLGMWGPTGYYDYASDGTRYLLVPGDHTMVAYGYDAGGVYLSDPAHGEYRYYDWGTFMWMWNSLDGMSLAVSWAS